MLLEQRSCNVILARWPIGHRAFLRSGAAMRNRNRRLVGMRRVQICGWWALVILPEETLKFWSNTQNK